MPSNNPSNPKKGRSKLNIFVGGPPPPGAVVFKPDGTIEPAPETSEAHYEWIVRKMTSRIEQEPDDGEWYFERGTALFALGRFADAIPDFSKLIGLVPGWGNCYRLRGLCFYHTSNHAKALDDLREYRRLWDPQRLESDASKILEGLEGAPPE
jgi:tetratricopeptide (TPR) repeat protein